MNALDITVDQWKALPEAERPRCDKIDDLITYLSAISGSLPMASTAKLSYFIHENGEAMTEASDINPILFNHKPEPTPVQLAKTPDEIISSHQGFLDNLTGGSLQEALENVKDSVITATDNMDHYYNQYSDCVDRLQRSRATLAELEKAVENSQGKDHTWIKNLMEGERFFQLIGVDFDSVLLYTRDPVTLRQYNPAAGVDVSVNLGQFWLRLKQGITRVYPLFGNIVYEGYVHPHISTSGGICWGDQKKHAAELMAAGRIEEYLNLLQSLLTTYSDSNPYKPLSRFSTESQKIGVVRSDSEGSFEGHYSMPIKSPYLGPYQNDPNWDVRSPLEYKDIVLVHRGGGMNPYYATVLGSEVQEDGSTEVTCIPTKAFSTDTDSTASNHKLSYPCRTDIEPLSPETQDKVRKAYKTACVECRDTKIPKGTEVRILKNDTFPFLNGQKAIVVKNQQRSYVTVALRCQTEWIRFLMNPKDVTPIPDEFYTQADVTRYMNIYEQNSRTVETPTNHICEDCGHEHTQLADFYFVSDNKIECNNCSYRWTTI